MTDFRTSTTALEIDAPQLRATQLVARPGTLPTITFPVAAGVWPDPAHMWQYLSEPAEFFAVPMPDVDELVTALTAFTSASGIGVNAVLAAVSVTIAEVDGSPQILVSGAEVSPWRRDAVRLTGGVPAVPAPRATDPWWRRMAARTTSRGEVDRLERWLNDQGHADVVTDDLPALGALIFSRAGGEVVSVENPEPTSVLDQLERCGAISVVERGNGRPVDAVRAWWISPRYQTHPVAEVHGTPFPVDANVQPPHARWS